MATGPAARTAMQRCRATRGSIKAQADFEDLTSMSDAGGD
jgi:hypothetical protein